MLIVDHFVGPSQFGVGLFTAQFIAKGDVVCNDDYRFIVEIKEEDIEKLPKAMRNAMKKYTYHGVGHDRLVGKVYFNMDDTRFINHSDMPNLKYNPEAEQYVAVCDIIANSELTCNYHDFAERGEACFNF